MAIGVMDYVNYPGTSWYKEEDLSEYLEITVTQVQFDANNPDFALK